MTTFQNLKFKVSSVAELKAVSSKLFALGYGIGSNRVQNFWNTRFGFDHYDCVLAYADGMILFGSPAQGWNRKSSFDSNENHVAVTVEEFLM
jgi:hypothetical protein